MQNQNRRIIPYLLFIIICYSFASCLSLKNSTSKSGKNNYESFYVGEEGNQYFIKPISFIISQSDELILVDFTFRFKNEIKDSAIINFSIVGPTIYKNIDQLILANNLMSIKTSYVKPIFHEKNGKNYVSRFTAKIPLSELKEIYNDNEWKFELTTKDVVLKLSPSNKTKKIIKNLKENVFVIM